jgi:hypothetical protein
MHIQEQQAIYDLCGGKAIWVLGTNGKASDAPPSLHFDVVFPHLRPNHVVKQVADCFAKGVRDEKLRLPELENKDFISGPIACHVRNEAGKGTGSARVNFLVEKLESLYDEARSGRQLAGDFKFPN